MLRVTVIGFIIVAVCLRQNEADEISIDKPITQFSLELLKIMTEHTKKNVVITPVGAYSLLAILQQGAGGNSKDINEVLHAASNTTKEGFRKLIASIEDADTAADLKLKHEAIFEDSDDFKPEFKRILGQDFRSIIYSEKYGGKTGSAGNKSLLDGAPLSNFNDGISSNITVTNKNESDAGITLGNYVCFNGMWAETFQDISFLFSPTQEKDLQVQGMLIDTFCFHGVSEDIGAKWIHIHLTIQKTKTEIPLFPVKRGDDYWSDRDVTMMIVLPTKKHGLDELIQRLTPAHLSQFMEYSIKDLKSSVVRLPKFIVNIRAGLIAPLKKLGLNDVFQKSTSNLLEILNQQEMYVSSIKQRGKIYLDEYGLRTTAAHEIVFPLRSNFYWLPNAGEPESFTVNEPFLFFVVDKENPLPLIAGKITRPR